MRLVVNINSKAVMSKFVRRLQIVLNHVQARDLSATASTYNVKPFIQAEPRVALYDDDVKITLHGFPAHKPLTLHGEVMQLSSKVTFASCAHFMSNSEGTVDVTCDASLGGTFTGVEPMGILWSLQTAPGQPRNTRMAINFTDRPCVVTLKVYKGHLSLEEIYPDQDTSGTHLHSPEAEIQLERSYRAPGVTRLEVEDGNIRGALYLPPGDGPFQGVIDMFGSSGGLIEYRSALLASRGFAALSLAYFKYKDLQPTLADLKFEYFQEAVEWLRNHPKVISSGIGTIGVSKGVETALLMATYIPEVTAAVAINGFCFATTDYLRHGQVFLKGGEFKIDEIHHTEEDGFDLRGAKSQLGEVIPIWHGNAKYLFFDSQDDYQKEPNINSRISELFSDERKKDIQMVKYEGAGHLLEPPYNPLCRSSINKGFGLMMKWGGKPKEHAYAQIDAWKRTLEFLRANIPQS